MIREIIMKKNISIVIIGFGSIGQRHYKNLRQLEYSNLSVYDPSDQPFAGQAAVVRLKKLNSQTAKNYQVAFICSPNHLHLKQALICARAGCHLFIEKPLSHGLAGMSELINLCRSKKLKVVVGHNLRFHPCSKFIKQFLEKNKLGKIYSIAHEAGSYLPSWRPLKDYRKNYSAKRATGGGIILDDIHEFDLLFWLNNFNQVIEEKFIYNNSGALEIETEDNCLAIFRFKNKVLGLVKCDYLQQAYSRNLKIVGENGNLRWDFKENIVWLDTKERNKKIFEIKDYDFNRTYIEEIKYFFDCIKTRKTVSDNLAKAVLVLKHCLNKK